MKPHAAFFFCFSFIMGLANAASAAEREFEWGQSAPGAQGISAEKIERMRDELAKHGTQGLLIIRHDKIVLEWYADGYSATKPHGTASLAKSLIGGMSLAVSMNDGRIAPGDLAAKFVP